MRRIHPAVACAAALLAVVACHVRTSPEATAAPAGATLAQVYYWRAKPGMLAAYTAYIRDVAAAIDEDARQFREATRAL